jgi:hypothetical protein
LLLQLLEMSKILFFNLRFAGFLLVIFFYVIVLVVVVVVVEVEVVFDVPELCRVAEKLGAGLAILVGSRLARGPEVSCVQTVQHFGTSLEKVVEIN